MWFNAATTADSDDVRVVGPTSLDAVDCRRFEARGATEIADDLVAEEATVEGATDIGGDVSVERFESKGATDVGGDLRVDSFQSKGAIEIVGSFEADEARPKGSIEVVGETQVGDLLAKGASRFADVEADSFAAKGSIAVEQVRADEIDVRGVVAADRLQAESVSLVLSGDTSTVETIVADDVDVVGDEESDSEGDLEATTIEGETVTIEYTDAEEVVGREVDIGPGCRVDLVRADELSIHSEATVGRTEPLE